MTRIDRMIQLSHILNNIGPVTGERCLQKLIYLVQSYEIPLGYKFSWDYYGPVSYSLENEIEEAETLGIINISWKTDVPIYSSNLKSAKQSHFWQKHLKLYPDISTQKFFNLNQVLSENISNPLLMETMASLTFLNASMNDKDRISQRLQELTQGRIDESSISLAKSLLERLV